MKKILHLGHSSAWRGGENQVCLLIHGLQQSHQGIENFVAYPKGAVVFNRLANNQLSKNHQLPLYSKNPYNPFNIFALVRFCKSHQIDVIHAHSAKAHSMAYHALFFLSAVKCVVHRRIDSPIKNQYFTKQKYRSSKISHWISISYAIEKRLINYGLARHKVTTLHDCIDASAYLKLEKEKEKKRYCEQYNWDKNTHLLGFAGALDKGKNPALLIQALLKLKQKQVEFNALIAGDGPLFDELDGLIKQHQLESQVKLLGFIKTMPEFFCSLDSFVLPSVHEGLGTVLLEAAQAKTALIASRVGGIVEVIEDKKTGRLFNSGEADELADVLTQIIQYKELTAQIVDNAFDKVSTEFNLQTMVNKTALIYERVLKHERL